MTAGQRTPLSLTALRATHMEFSRIGSATATYGMKRVQVTGEQLIRIFGDERIPELINNINQIHHHSLLKST